MIKGPAGSITGFSRDPYDFLTYFLFKKKESLKSYSSKIRSLPKNFGNTREKKNLISLLKLHVPCKSLMW